MFTLETIDISGLGRSLNGLSNALVGTGQTGALAMLVRTEVRQLAWEISNELGPKTLEKASAKMEKDLKKVFHPAANSRTGEAYELFEGKQAGNGDTRWLYAGPNFLVGISPDDYVPGLSADQMQTIYNNLRHTDRGIAWPQKGIRGKQHVIILNRLLVAKQRFKEFLKLKINRLGRLRAIFAYSAFLLGHRNIPAWIKKHFDSVSADGRAIFDVSKLSGPNPEITFGGSAPGVQSNPHIQKKIQTAIHRREEIAHAKLRKVLMGAVYDFNTGAIYRPPAETSHTE
jgi:hypothetical protein